MSTILNEVATNVATREQYTQTATRNRYNWNSVIKVLTKYYTPDIVCEILRKCHFTYSTYIIANAENVEKEAAGEQLLMVSHLYDAVADMYKEPCVEEEDDEEEEEEKEEYED